MKINSMLGQFAGTITFTDNTVETFHSQGEFNAPAGGTPTSLIWSVDENGSREAIKQAAWLHNPNYPVDYPHYPYWSGINVFWTLAVRQRPLGHRPSGGPEDHHQYDGPLGYDAGPRRQPHLSDCRRDV